MTFDAVVEIGDPLLEVLTPDSLGRVLVAAVAGVLAGRLGDYLRWPVPAMNADPGLAFRP